MFSSLTFALSAALSLSAVSYAIPTNTTLTLVNADDYSNGPFTGGVATYYYQGGAAGACGNVNTDDALICAISQARYGASDATSPLCGRQVQITNLNNQQMVTVTIQDDCPGCDENSIDLSVGAFQQLDDLSVGTFPIEWSFV